MLSAVFLRRVGDTEGQFERIENLIQVIPSAPLGHGLKGLQLIERDQLESARGALVRGLSLHPESPWLHYLLGELFLKSGETARAAEVLNRVLSNDGAMTEARILLARAELLLGNEAARQAQVELLMGPTTSLEDRTSFAMDHGSHLAALGRLKEGESLLARAAEELARDDAILDSVALWRRIATISWHLEEVESLERSLEALRKLALQPEFEQAERLSLTAWLLRQEGLLSALQGDLDQARSALEGLEGLGPEYFSQGYIRQFLTEPLEAEVLALEGRVDEARDLLSGAPPCMSETQVERMLRTGPLEARLEHAQTALQLDCSAMMHGSLREAQLRVNLAEVYLAQGERLQAEQELANYHALSFQPDESLPLALRVQRLGDAMGL
jgi:predicted Zn-dependent protease